MAPFLSVWEIMNQTNQKLPSISVITATYNCVNELPKLIDSLRHQTDKNFEWIVSDGGSSDGTLDLLEAINDINIEFISEKDFGIYDALNKALALSSGEYYLVAGADDCFAEDAISNFRGAIVKQSFPDILPARVLYGNYSFEIKQGPSWLFGCKSFIANHSVGTAFKKELHERFGLYSSKFPIAADSLFIIKACKGGATLCKLEFVAGEIGIEGVSAVDWAGSATELFRVQLICGESLFIQTILLILRIIKGASAWMKSLSRSISWFKREDPL
ncbi:MAG: glycosyltransferase [Paracoccaceae bacterium]